MTTTMTMRPTEKAYPMITEQSMVGNQDQSLTFLKKQSKYMDFKVSRSASPAPSETSNTSTKRTSRPTSHRLKILSSLFNHSDNTTPPVQTSSVNILLLPQDGAHPQLLRVRTVDTRSDNTRDNNLSHIPDMRSFWGDGQEWSSRRSKYSSLAIVKGDEDHPLTGTYVLLYTTVEGKLDRNQRWKEGVFGDACICKMSRNSRGANEAATYEDIEKDFVDSGLWKKFLVGLFDAPKSKPRSYSIKKSNSTPLPLHLQTQKACTLSQPTPPNTKKPLLYIPPNSPCSPIQQLHHLPPQPIRNPSLSRGAPTRKKSVFTQEAIFSRGVNQGNRNGRDYEISSPIVHQTMEEVRHVEVEKMLGVQVLRDAENRISFTGVELDTDGAMI